MLYSRTFVCFYHYDQKGLAAQKPWHLLSIQGENNTIWAHASNYFESVLDIVNYQNMMLDGLQGKMRRSSTAPPKDDHRPERWKLDAAKCLAQMTGALSRVVRIVLNCLWTLLWIVLWPLNILAFFRIQRYGLQWMFRTEHIGWNPLSFSMKKFIDISPSTMESKFNWIKRPHSALQWNFLRLPSHDPRVCSSPESGDPRAGPKVRARFLPLFPPYCPNDPSLFHRPCHGCEFHLTGYGYVKRDDKGTHFYVPKCHMLERARKDYPEMQAERICTHLCKILSEEAMGSVGINIAFEPNRGDGSCAVRGQPSRASCCCDNMLLEW